MIDMRILYIHFPERVDSKIKENISKLIHTRFNEEGPWPDAAKAYEDLINKLQTVDDPQKIILEKVKTFFPNIYNG